MKHQKVAKVGVKKYPGFLYYVDRDGDVSQRNLALGDMKKIAKVGISQEPGYKYFIDEEGDISRYKEIMESSAEQACDCSICKKRGIGLLSDL